MAEAPRPHHIDVGIRTVVMQRAKERVNKLRQEEQHTYGVAKTTMASVGRDILTNWTPEKTRPVGVLAGLPADAAGNRITQRGHRKYARENLDRIPEPGWKLLRESPTEGDKLERAHQLLELLQKVADPARGTTLGPIASVKRVAEKEGLLDLRVKGKSLSKHISAAERAVLKPLRFTLPEHTYQDIVTRLTENHCTVTRALEVGLIRFADTGRTK